MTSKTAVPPRRILRAAAALLAAFALALAAPLPAPRGTTPVAGSFETTMGYTPERAAMPDGSLRAIKPTGACSAPTGATRYDFAAACKAHDFGYDQLRYAAASGRPLSPDARRRMDETLARDLHGQCGTDSWCHAVAAVYATGTTLNSWRQLYGPPVAEPAALWATRAALAVALLTAVRAGGSIRPLRFPTPHPR